MIVRGLALHPDFTCKPVARIDIEIARPQPSALALRYVVTGDIAALKIAAPAASARTDELWKHTCCEAFLKPPGAENYVEFNLAPSSKWAVYRFSAYRTDMRDAEDVAAPKINFNAAPDRFELRAQLMLPSALDGWRLGLSTVIEEASGAVCYWALAHAPGKPDFHAPVNFALDVPPVERP
ncbi:MAG: DOMON-like domain-containing protein [Hyphomonadaceae bacterium]